MVYVSRKDKAVVNPAPVLVVNQPHSVEHGLVAEEYNHCLSHADAHYVIDNKILYEYLEETTCGTILLVSIKSYERTRNSRGKWWTLNTQHTGKSKWSAILKEAENYINGIKWDGNPSTSLEKHANNKQRHYNNMETAAEHIPYQLSNGCTKVQRFADSQ